MEIVLNGKLQEVTNDIFLSRLVSLLGLTGRRLAVEINQEVISRSRYDGIRIRPGDKIEIIHAIGGG